MSSNPHQVQQQQIQRRDDDHDQDEGAAGGQQLQMRRRNSGQYPEQYYCSSESHLQQQQHQPEGLMLPTESSPCLRYTDLEDCKLKAFGCGAYGTTCQIQDQEDPLQPKPMLRHPSPATTTAYSYPAPTPHPRSSDQPRSCRNRPP